jgi:uncharacterized membrane protein YiaA
MSSKKESTTQAFIITSWSAFAIGVLAYIAALWNMNMETETKGYYFTVFMFGLYAAVSVQKSVRDKIEGIPVSDIYYGISWLGIILALLLFGIALYNTDEMNIEQKGFYTMSYVLSLFASIVVQKNTRDQLEK